MENYTSSVLIQTEYSSLTLMTHISQQNEISNTLFITCFFMCQVNITKQQHKSC